MRTLYVLVLCMAFVSLARADDAILILDASKSMWGRVEGKTKIEIARSVVGGLLDDLPADRRLGFVAYGHRRASDCKDIEQIAAVGTDRGQIRAALSALEFKGKTPLTAAVQFAAEKLQYTQNKATVILVSDGIESCSADPCAAAAALEKAGADLTVHVVGFGLKKGELKKLKCVADATGGKYFSANNAAELSGALKQTVVEQEPPLDGKATLTAPARIEVGKDLMVSYTGPGFDGDQVTLADLGTRAAMLHGALASAFNVSGKSGSGRLLAPIKPGTYEVRYVIGRETVAASSRLEVTPATATVQGPASVAAGADFEVSWSGPGNSSDSVTLCPPDSYALASVFGNSQPAREGTRGKVTLNAPSRPGPYELHYELLGRETLARQRIEVVPVQATVRGPSSVVVDADFEVRWTGPNNERDYITLARPDVQPAASESLLSARDSKGAGKLRAPSKPGTYELRYVLRNEETLASQAITVVGR
ncbi:MAG: VWA domain-containing protein [Polyangiales bacterium]